MKDISAKEIQEEEILEYECMTPNCGVVSKELLDYCPNSASSMLKPSAAKTRSPSFQFTSLHIVFSLIFYSISVPLERLYLICLFAFRHFAMWKSSRLPRGY